MARTAVWVGLGLCWLACACGGSSQPPSGAHAGATSTGGAGGSGAAPTTAGTPGAGGVGTSGACAGCAGEPSTIDPVCEPNALWCEDNRVIACTPDGSGTSLWIDCGSLNHCVELKGSALCEANACTPNALVCDGNLLKTCTDDGTLPKKGKDCGDEVCDAGACRPQVCEPSSLYCKDNAVYACSATGAEENVSFMCDERLICRDDGAEPECVARICEPTKAACIDEILGTCADDGLSLAATGTDCGASDYVCDLVAGCGPSATDTIGKRKEVEAFSGGELATNMLDVRSSRTLLEIEVNWLLEQPRDVRFVVYELMSDDLFHVRYDEITSNNNGSGFFSSGPIAVPLQAGKRYLVGAGLVVGEGYAYYEGSGWTSLTSFATTLGGVRTGHADEIGFGLNTSSLYMLRLKTSTP